MSELEDSFAKLLGRQPTDADRQALYRVRDALGLRGNDALWLVLIALQHYQGQYERMPEAIAQASRDILGAFRASAEASAKAAAAEAKADLSKAVAAVAQEVAHKVAGAQQLRWGMGLTVGLAILLGVSLGFAFYMEQVGLRAGRAAGYEAAQDEKAAADWANTPEGQTAYQFARSGSLYKVTRCEQPGWWIEDGACYVGTAPDGMIHGWVLPQEATRKPIKSVKPKK